MQSDRDKRVRALDLFCGVGGSSWGAKNAGVEIVAGFDSWSVAGEAFCANFPDAWLYEDRLEDITPREIAQELGDIDLILASPECTNHSPAKGSAPRCEASKDTAFQVLRFARAFNPRWVVVENVVSMRRWTRYRQFVTGLERLGYAVRELVLNAADFGVPQARRRLFLIADSSGTPRAPAPRIRQRRTAQEILDWNGSYRYTPLDSPRRAPATLERARRAIRELGEETPFLLVYYGSDGAGGWQRIGVPLRTITTVDRFALVRPSEGGHEMRMLQIPELKRAMGMPVKFNVPMKPRRAGVKLTGNAVCPPVMRHVIASLIRNNGG